MSLMNKKISLLLLALIPIYSWGQSHISLSTATAVGEKMYFFLTSPTDIKAEGVSGDLLNGDWSEVVVQSPTIKIIGEITVANFTRGKLKQVDLSPCPHIREISLSYNQIEQLTLGTQLNLTSIKVAGNRLSEEQMRLLVRSLPDRTSTTPGVLYAKDCKDPEDFNALMPEMLRDAKARNWQVKICVYSKEKIHGEWIDYDGSNAVDVEAPSANTEWLLLLEGDRVRVVGAESLLYIQVYSVGGDLLCEQRSGLECSLEGLPSGCYLVRLSCAEKVTVQKVLKL